MSGCVVKAIAVNKFPYSRKTILKMLHIIVEDAIMLAKVIASQHFFSVPYFFKSHIINYFITFKIHAIKMQWFFISLFILLPPTCCWYIYLRLPYASPDLISCNNIELRISITLIPLVSPIWKFHLQYLFISVRQ